MSADQIIFVCSNCGQETARWQGRCHNCGEWNTLKEFHAQREDRDLSAVPAQAVDVKDIKNAHFNRISTKISEADRVLGDGIVPGSITILGGDPGIGKSTLLLQISDAIDNVLYISGEESLQQIKLHFDRLGLQSKTLKILAENNLSAIVKTIQELKPKIVVVDSIQTVYSSDFLSTAGSIVQVKECAMKLQRLAKSTQTSVILVGHVTKEGSVAGPRTLEHLVDVVIYLEGERFHGHRILRSVKNRFGATDEIGIFEMKAGGLVEVSNPSKIFLDKNKDNVAGTVVTATVEGSRALLVEVQALTARTVFGYPQRRSSGFDLNRLQLILAVLQKRSQLDIADQDVFINIVGGIKLVEPAADLAVALAVASSFKNKPIGSELCAYGELGLSGEIRHVNAEPKRQAEARRLGFTKFIKERNIIDTVRRYCA